VARKVDQLTTLKVQREKRDGYYADGRGLYLQVKGASKTWVLRVKVGQRTREMGMGSVHDVPLAIVRERATKARDLAKQGIDPIEEARATKARNLAAGERTETFKTTAERFITTHAVKWRNAKHGQQWRNTLAQYAYPVMGNTPVHLIDTDLVLKALRPIWNTKPETASRLRARIEKVLDVAKVEGRRTGENPARWAGHLNVLLPAPAKVRAVKHYAALPWKDAGRFIVDLRKTGGTAARALELLILTVGRTNEVLGAKWSEFHLDDEAPLWIVPGERMKGGKDHRVPLSAPAVALLKSLHAERQSDLVFPGLKSGRPLSNMAMLVLLRRMNRHGVTSHGFRSTFRDWVRDNRPGDGETAEAALAHVAGTKVERAYARSDMVDPRRELMEAWAHFCGEPYKPKDKGQPPTPGDNVVRLKRRA
jgi:integrase